MLCGTRHNHVIGEFLEIFLFFLIILLYTIYYSNTITYYNRRVTIQPIKKFIILQSILFNK